MISFQQPSSYILLCLLPGILYAGLLYYRHYFIKDPTPFQKHLMKFLGFLRFLSASVLAILLLSPFLKFKITEIRKPAILILQDNSESIKNSLSSVDSLTYRNALLRMVERLKNTFDVREYSFSESLTPGIDFSFSGKITNLSESLNELISLYSSENTGALVVATDGIYNKGGNPLYAGRSLKFPIYTIALGDTSPKKDLKINRVLYNEIVYLNDKFRIRVEAEAINFPGARTVIQVSALSDAGSGLDTQSKEVDFSPSGFADAEFILEASKPGLLKYRVRLIPVAGEFTAVNNSMDIFIDVLDSRQKILLLAHAPHPDLAALKRSIENNKNYEVVLKIGNDITSAAVEDFQVVILHQLPSRNFPIPAIQEQIKKRRIPVFYIVGARTDMRLFNSAQSVMEIRTQGAGMNEVLPAFQADFSLFTISEELSRQLGEWPPVFSPFGEFSASPAARKLLLQKIGSVQTNYPLMLFDETSGQKIAILSGEGLWRWSAYNYRETGNQNAFHELIGKTIQYLSVKEDKRQFKVRMPKNVFYENEPITMQAELYNDSYELINTPDVAITIVDEEGKEFPYLFDKTSNGYALDAGNFPVGDYTFRAVAKLGGRELSYTGKFSVIPLQLEAYNTVANHQLLYQLSQKSGGKMFRPDQIDALTDSLLNNNQIKAVMYSTYRTSSVIDLWWLLLVVSGMLALEWFIRKYEGGY
ncbi:MAG: hypothetical protein KatS3mg031_1113 [Chitinophagales bacterium]|nr:MAG: hypothetical protein KatS3mg031_1113 [Chitinophagales bacterium]